jgi:hypothetical protein
VAEGSEPLSIIKSGMGNSRNLASGNPLPLSPPIIVLIKNLTLEGNEWLEALKNMSLDIGPSSQAHRGSDTFKSDLSPGDPPSPKRLCCAEDDSSSSSFPSENSSTHYFLRSQKKTTPSGGLGKEVIMSLDRGGRGRKSLISKAQSKARFDLLAGKQQSIERELRAVRPQGKGLWMKCMSFNCRGLVGSLKKPALKRVIFSEHPDVLLLQETLGEGEEVKSRLELLLPGWKFETLDALGRSGGLE